MPIHRKLACGLAAGCALATAGGVALASNAGTSAAGLPQLRVTLTGKSMAVSSQKMSGAVDVVTNTTGEPVGNPVFIHLNPGVSDGQALAVLKSAGQDPNPVRRIGAIVFDPNAPKGTATHVQVDLQPGNYLALDAAGFNGPGPSSGPPPITTFTIGQSDHPAALPRPAATVRAIEFAFRGAGTLRSGSLVRWQNDGYVVHMFLMFRATRDFPAARIMRLLRAGKDRQIPMSLGTVAGAGPLSYRASEQQRLDLRPGTYVVACFMDTQDHREHTTLGMERTLKVVR